MKTYEFTIFTKSGYVNAIYATTLKDAIIKYLYYNDHNDIDWIETENGKKFKVEASIKTTLIE